MVKKWSQKGPKQKRPILELDPNQAKNWKKKSLNIYLTAFVTEFFRLPTKMATSSFSFRSSLVLLNLWPKWPKRPKNCRKWPKFLKYLPDCLCHGIFSAANQDGNLVFFFSLKFSLAQFLATRRSLDLYDLHSTICCSASSQSWKHNDPKYKKWSLKKVINKKR